MLFNCVTSPTPPPGLVPMESPHGSFGWVKFPTLVGQLSWFCQPPSGGVWVQSTCGGPFVGYPSIRRALSNVAPAAAVVSFLVALA